MIGRLLLRPQEGLRISRGTLFVGGLLANILFLCYYKYSSFFLQLVAPGISHNWARPSFPLGISFYTIYQIMFLVDCYEGLVDHHNWLDHFVFAGLFSYVTMGPIVRWKLVVPQLNGPNASVLNADNVARGLFLFVCGLFKKAVLADSFFRWADAGFSWQHPLSMLGGWLAAFAFTFELYFDFSGYTDMALGVALMLNLNLPQNFNSPFRAQSIIDFWRRWHITLTNFITTYLYTPMIRAFPRPTFGAALAATFLAMVIAGFWHGPDWTFLIFGALHGGALVINQCWKKMKLPMPPSLGGLLTFTFVVLSLVFFRSPTASHAVDMLRSMFTLHGGFFNYEPWNGIDHVDQVLGITWMSIAVGIVFWAPNSMELERTFRPSWRMVALTVTMAVIACIYVNGVVSRSFVYRDF
jgi:D-alanyl-lipoteichoic acid acyltransferase DltB (MBOAT superfamily)